MIKLRRYNKDLDGEIYPSFDNLYIEFDNDYIPVNVIATGLKGEPGDIVVKFEHDGEDVVRRRSLNGHSFFIKDDTIPLEKNGFYTCGYKTEDGRWYKWILCFKEMVQVNNLCYKLFYALGGNNGAAGEVRIDGYSSAQEWIRKAEDDEIELLKVKALESPEKCIVDMAKKIFEKPVCEFKPFDKILIRDYDHQLWRPAFFGRYIEDSANKYVCMNGEGYLQCIKYEGNEKLCWTKENPE